MKKLYFKIIILLLITFNGVTFHDLKALDNINLSFNEEEYVLIEKNIIDKSFISYLYKDVDNNYIGKIYNYDTLEEISVKDLIKEDKIIEYNEVVEKLLYLKYPKFIADVLKNNDVERNYVLRDNELVIYFSNYEINPEVNELLYLTINYNEIKNYLNFTALIDANYENESGYNYTNAKKLIAITFDDSPNTFNTTKILKSLKDNHFHATFFVLGEKSLNNEDILLSIKANGNEIGSHTYSHQNLNKLTKEEVLEDYEEVNNIYKRLFNEDIKLFRPPYGIYKDIHLNALNTSFILWSLDTNDWKYRNSDYLVNYVIDNVKDGDIILFHDTYDTTVKAVEELLPILYSKGYLVMSVSELAKLKGVELINHEVYNKFN